MTSPLGRLSLQLLDGFSLRRDGETIPLIGAAQRTLAFVAIQGGSHRRVISHRLWPDSLDQTARGNLRTALWALNQRVPGVVATTGDHVRMSSDVEVDLDVLRTVARRFITPEPGGAMDDAEVEMVAHLVRRELLPGWDDDWLLTEQEQVRQLRLHALEALSSELRARGRHAQALHVALEAVRLEPLRESSNAAVIAAHLSQNNVAEAVRHYELFKERLLQELGCHPSKSLNDTLPSRVRRHSHPS